MSEVRTCKCDICGEVFHVVPNEHVKYHMSREYEENGEKAVKLYTDICPRCCRNVYDIIKDPEIIQKEYRSRRKLEDCMCQIFRLGNRVASFWFGAAEPSEPSYYEDIKEDIINNYKSMEKSKDKWKKWCITFVFAYVIVFAMSIINIII